MDTVQARSRRSRTVIEQGIKGDEESKENGGIIKKVNSIPANSSIRRLSQISPWCDIKRLGRLKYV